MFFKIQRERTLIVKNKIFIGLIGKNGSGKSTVCQFLKEKGFGVVSLSDYVREEAARQGLALNRDNLIETANRLKAEKGLSFLAEKAIDQANLKAEQGVVLDSIRNVDEINALKEARVIICSIEATLESRYKRIKERQDGTDDVDFDTFKRQDEIESSGESSGQNIDAALGLAEVHLLNEGNLDGLYEQIETRLIHVYCKEFQCQD